MYQKHSPTHRSLSVAARAQLQVLHEKFPLVVLQSALQTNAYTLARAKAGAPLLLSQANALEQHLALFWDKRAA